jgi:hypothetical protein
MKTSLYILLILLAFISCKEKDEMKYKQNTKDVLFKIT